MHPDPATFQAYLLGTLPPSEADTLEHHLQACPDCETAISVTSLTSDPVMDRLMRGEVALPFAEEAQVRDLVERAEKLRTVSDVETIPSVLTVVTSPNPIPADSIAADFTPANGASQRPTNDLPPTLGEYELGHPLGSGGMGTVVRATHRRLRRAVAVKVLRLDTLTGSAARERFAQEMRAVGRLEHRHIVRAFDAGEVDGRGYLAMELVRGLDMAEVAGHARLTTADACEVVRQAALGIAAAHRAGLVHRDIKPSNLMLARIVRDEDGADDAIIKVLDLGLARIAPEHGDGSALELTTDGQVMGTPDYMAPEQASSSHAAGPEADVYSLGATLFRLLTGRTPLDVPPDAGLMPKLRAIATGATVDLRGLRPDLPAELVTLIHQTLSQDPASRPTVAHLIGRLGPWTGGHRLLDLLEDAERLKTDRTTERPIGGLMTLGPGTLESTRTEERDRSLGDAGASEASAQTNEHGRPATALVTAGSKCPGRPRRWVLAAGLSGAAILALGLFLLLIRTEHGTLVVEIHDPSVTALVDGGRLTLTDTNSGREYSITLSDNKQETVSQLPRGAYRVDPPTGTVLDIRSDDGSILRAEQFELADDRTVRVRVARASEEMRRPEIAGPVVGGPSHQDRKANSNRDPPVDDVPSSPIEVDRRVAAWVASVGGTGEAFDHTGKLVPFSQTQPLTIKPHGFRSISIGEATPAQPWVPIRDEDVAILRSASRIDWLRLRSQELTNTGLLSALPPDRLSHLKKLYLAAPLVTGNAIAHILQHAQLESLAIYHPVPPEIVPSLVEQKGLWFLDIQTPRWSDQDFAKFADLAPTLEYLNLTDAFTMSRDSLRRFLISRDNRLREFNFWAGSAPLQRLRSEDFSLIGELAPNVERVFLTFQGCDDSTMMHLANLENLRTIRLRDTQVSDQGLLTLAQLTRIEMVGLYGNHHVTEAGVRQCLDQYPKCTIEFQGQTYRAADLDDAIRRVPRDDTTSPDGEMMLNTSERS